MGLLALFLALFLPLSMVMGQPTPAFADDRVVIPDSGFEDGSISSWIASGTPVQFSTPLGNSGQGTGFFSGEVTFNAPSRGISTCEPSGVAAALWAFGAAGGTSGALQPKSNANFDGATSALGLAPTDNAAIKQLLEDQRVSSGCGGDSTPTDAEWIKREFTLEAGKTYRMAWNYVGTDYVPFNDGSLTSLVYKDAGTSTVTINNQVQSYALLGFTNPGTGDYSTGSYGSTGWQTATYSVSVTGKYDLGFAVFNMGDTSLSPLLFIDDLPGTTTKDGAPFTPVISNNPLLAPEGGGDSDSETAPTQPAPAPPKDPAIGLDLAGKNGRIVEGTPVIIGGTDLPPGAGWSVKVFEPEIVLATGSAPPSGNVSGQFPLPALAGPGTYTIRFQVDLGAGGVLELYRVIQVAADGTISDIGVNAVGSAGVKPVEPLRLAYTGLQSSTLPWWALVSLAMGILLVLYSIRARGLIEAAEAVNEMAQVRTPWEILSTPISVPGITYTPQSTHHVSAPSLRDSIRELDLALSRTILAHFDMIIPAKTFR
jgi:hypothetical protein